MHYQSSATRWESPSSLAWDSSSPVRKRLHASQTLEAHQADPEQPIHLTSRFPAGSSRWSAALLGQGTP